MSQLKRARRLLSSLFTRRKVSKLPVAPSTIPTLVLDILPIIAQYLCDDHDYSALHACSLACRAWSAYFQPYLFRCITLHTNKRVSTLHERLCQNPSLTSYIRDLSLDFRVLRPLPVSLMTTLVSLDTIRIVGLANPAWIKLPHFQPLVQSLTLLPSPPGKVVFVRASAPTSALCQVLSVFSHAKHCELNMVGFADFNPEDWTVPTSVVPPPMLSSLKISVRSFPKDGAFFRQLVDSGVKLHSLDVEFHYMEQVKQSTVCEFIQNQPSLCHLSIGVRVPKPGDYNGYVLHTTAFPQKLLLTSLTSLTSLALDVPSHISVATDWLQQLPSPHLLASLCLNLPFTTYDPYEVEHLDSLLSDRFCWLKELSIRDTMNEGEWLQTGKDIFPKTWTMGVRMGRHR
ncbi:unnamed protein product [Somion occarium]|uniref:F-box domain-containing protein n=1 Tax=Somion occarium TaxID=3059160 RepID=A0ABP1D8P1_9APHY